LSTLNVSSRLLSTLNVSSRLSPQDFAKLFVARRRELEDLHLMSSRKLTQIAAKTSAPQPGLASDKPPFRLTQHENEALVFAARGLPREQIAAAMGISRSTVRAHLGNAMEKLKARNIAHAVAIAMAASVIWP
jgi:DNA-binding CsgD family transcriptional regulator